MQGYLSLRAAGVQRSGLPSLREWACGLQRSAPSHSAPLRQRNAREGEALQRSGAQQSCCAGSHQQDAQPHHHDARSHQHGPDCGHDHGDEPVHLNASASEEEGAVAFAGLLLCCWLRLPHASTHVPFGYSEEASGPGGGDAGADHRGH